MWLPVLTVPLFAAGALLFPAASARAAMPTAMRPQTPTMQHAALIAALQRQEMALVAAVRQTEMQIGALMRLPASPQRNALIAALQRQDAALMAAIRQVAAQIAALQRG
jgi:hypothetical protein